MEKVTRNGKVAVLVSPGYGSGWSTEADVEIRARLLFDPEVVAWVEGGKMGPLPDIKNKYYPHYFYDGGAKDLVIKWIPVGIQFRIEVYDGYESLHVEEEYQWYTA